MEMEMDEIAKPPTTEAVERWFDRFGKDRPDVPPTQGHWVDSFGVIMHSDGLAISFAVRGSQPVTLFLNALVASALVQNISTVGPLGGWMDEEGALIVTDPEGRHRWRTGPAN